MAITQALPLPTPVEWIGWWLYTDLPTSLAWNAKRERAEAVQKALSAGVEVQGMREELQALGMQVEPFLPTDGERAGQWWPLTRQQGLSLGDRACLSLGLRLGLRVVIWDRPWAELPLELGERVLPATVCPAEPRFRSLWTCRSRA